MDSWVTSTLESLGYFGVTLLMLFENLFPPIPSEVVMPLAGYTSAQGDLSLVGVIAAGTFGSVLGALFWYYIARWLGEERLKSWARRHGRWITFGPGEIERADRWFDRHGGWVVFFGRCVPAIRTLIGIPAGIFGMALVPYVALTTAGTAIWTGGLAVLGWWLGKEWTSIETYVGPVTYAVIGAVVVIYLYRVITFGRAGGRAGAETRGRRP